MERDFSQDELERSYNGLYMLFEELLGTNQALVILTDGTYRTEFQRNSLREISRRCNVPFVLIKVYVTELVTLARINERFASGKGSGSESYFSAKAAYENPADALLLENMGDNETLREKVRTLAPIILQQSTGAS